MTYDTHIARLINDSEFDKASFKRNDVHKGIESVTGNLKGTEDSTTVSYIFDAEKYTVQQAKNWLEQNHIRSISVETIKGKEMKPLLLYAPIYSYTAELFVEKMLEVDESEDLEIWMNSPGGSPFAGWSIIGALNERTGKNNVKVFGDASSMAFYMLLFMDHAEGLDVNNYTIHRADGYVTNDEEKLFLAKINKQLRAKMEKRLDAKVFQEVTGKSFDEIFDPETRIDVNIDAKQAKKIGLIDRTIRLEPSRLKAMSERFVAFADFDEQGSPEIKTRGSVVDAEITKDKNIELKNTKKMTKDELKAQSPDVYNAIYKEGRQAGIDAEKDRTEAFLEFNDIDPEAVGTAIKEGKAMSQKFMAEMSRKSFSAEKLKEAKDESPESQKTKKDEPKAKTEEEIKVEAEAKEFVKAAREGADLKPVED